MNKIQLFKNEEFGQIRSLELEGKPYFVAKDIAELLGYKNTNDAIIRHCKGVVKHDGFKINGIEIALIPEGDLYRLIIKSQLPSAEKFEKWVMEEVLPTIRKHGMYAKDELLDNPDLLLEVVSKLKTERDARIKAEESRNKLIHQNKLYTTSEIAKELNLKSANQLNNLLSDKKIQYKQNKTWLLYSKYSNCGYVSIKQDILDNGHIIYDRKWTGKGRDFILDLLRGDTIE